MKKIDDILNQLQHQQPIISDPDELTNRIIDNLPDLDLPKAKPTKRVRFYVASAFAVAASVLLLFMLTTNQDTNDTEKSTAQNDIIRREQTLSPSRADSYSAGSEPDAHSKAYTTSLSRELTAKEVTRKANRTDRQFVVRHHTRITQAVRSENVISATDSLDYYINKIERELAQVDDSLYIERIHRVMHADERLQRIVNNYILNELYKDVQPHEASLINPITNDDDEE